MRRCWLPLLVLSCLFVRSGRAEETVRNVRLKDASGKAWSLDEPKDARAVVVVFLGTQCPINNAYLPRLRELYNTYAAKGVAFFAINSNEHDSVEAIRSHAQKHKLAFPVLKDDGQAVAKRFGAERVPEAFVLDAGRLIRYQGRIDDQFGLGYQRPQPTKQFLVDALEEVLAGKQVTQTKVAVEGCYITRSPKAPAEGKVTFAKHIAPILQRCQECHRPGQIGPMPLLSYDDASAWSQMIKEVVADRRMPPWHADPKYGKFFNDRSLSRADREMLLAWIDQGCPKGDEKDLPPPRKFVDGWRIGQPDAVVTMTKEFMVPAQAPKKGIPYKYVVVPTNFDEDKWIQAAEAKPGNPSVVHHIIVYVSVGGKRLKDLGDGIGSGMLVAFAPGDFGSVYAPGSAKKIPKGASLIFQMHYTPNGVEQPDRSSVGFIFAKEPPKHEVKTKAIAQQLLFIMPNSDNQRFKSIATFRNDSLLWNLTPHMHLRGKSFEYEAVYPDGKRETILSVPRYDFGWQASYRFEKPLLLPAGSRIECTGTFDNSANNPNNPDPTKLVRWGEQTWEEMLIGFVDYTSVGSAEKK